MKIRFHDNGKIKEEYVYTTTELYFGIEYDKDGRILTHVLANGDVFLYTYEENLQKIYLAEDLTDEQRGKISSGELDIPSIAEEQFALHLEKGLPKSMTCVEDGKIVTTFSWTHNTQGKCTRSVDDDGCTFEMTYDENGRIKNAAGIKRCIGNEGELRAKQFSYTYTNTGNILSFTDETKIVGWRETLSDDPVNRKFIGIKTYQYNTDGSYDGFTLLEKQFDNADQQIRESTTIYNSLHEAISTTYWYLTTLEEIDYKVFCTNNNTSSASKKYQLPSNLLVEESETVRETVNGVEKEIETTKFYREDGIRVSRTIVRTCVWENGLITAHTQTITEYKEDGSKASQTTESLLPNDSSAS